MDIFSLMGLIIIMIPPSLLLLLLLLSHSCPTLCDPVDCSTPGVLSFTISQSLLTLMPIESVTPSSHLVLCHHLLLLPSIFLNIKVFSNESSLCIRWPKYRSFEYWKSPSNEYSGLISFRIDWFNLPAVLGVLGLSKVFSNTTVQKHQIFGIHPSSSNSHIHT